MRRLLDRLDPAVMPRITLQDCLGLAAEYGAGGVHSMRAILRHRKDSGVL